MRSTRKSLRRSGSFFVIQNAHRSLLCKRTAEELKVLKVGLSVQVVEESGKVTQFPKLPNVLVKFVVDKNVTPRKAFFYRVPAAVEHLVEKKLQEMLRADIIERVKEPTEWLSQMVVVPKGPDDIRICINMKYPNEAIKRENYPLPVIENFLIKLRGCKVFSKLDITSAYHHVELHPESRKLTTFMTKDGPMRYKRLNFGVNSAPEIFQRLIEEMLSSCDGAMNFIDDIVLGGYDKSEHDKRLSQLLATLKKNNVKLNKEKCQFGVSEINFMGFVISAKGIRPSDEKIKAIQNFRKPKSNEEIRSFLGLVTFVGHFISNLATKSEPLRLMLRDQSIEWGEAQEKAFNLLRLELVENVRTLGFYDPKDETFLFTDASPWGLGAVLIQKNKIGTKRIISYAAKSLTIPERNYAHYEKEALAVVWAIEKFYFYLFGVQFTVCTDQESLKKLFSKQTRRKESVHAAEPKAGSKDWHPTSSK